MLSFTGVRISDKITSSINEGLIILGRNGEILTANKAVLEIFGYGSEKPENVPLEKIEKSLATVTAGLKNGTEDFEMQTVTGTGENKILHVSIRPLETEIGRSGSVCIVRDITEKKKDELELAATVEELKRSNEELERFAYVASHDLKEPLRMVASYVQLLKRKSAEKFTADEIDYINFASDGAMRMDELISDLLDYSRVRTKGQEFVETDLNAVVYRIMDILKFRIQDKKANVVIAEKLPVVRADSTQMEHLFQNLIDNALKFSGSAPVEIRIKSVKKDGFYEISFKDNGIGIDMQFKDRIFQIFQRLHSREEYEGTGIGLAICKKIVERHNGQMWMESEGEDKGSTFFFTLPV
jgi:PAS domain S-box-containing protein